MFVRSRSLQNFKKKYYPAIRSARARPPPRMTGVLDSCGRRHWFARPLSFSPARLTSSTRAVGVRLSSETSVLLSSAVRGGWFPQRNRLHLIELHASSSDGNRLSITFNWKYYFSRNSRIILLQEISPSRAQLLLHVRTSTTRTC